MVDRLKVKDLRHLGDAELLTKRDELRDALYHLRYKMHVEEVENPNAKKELKHNIARIMTVLRERQLQSAAEPEQS